jgi:hypothetical protein
MQPDGVEKNAYNWHKQKQDTNHDDQTVSTFAHPGCPCQKKGFSEIVLPLVISHFYETEKRCHDNQLHDVS